MKHLPQYPRIASSDLAEHTLDTKSARRFDYQFAPTLLGGMLLGCVCLLVGYLLYRAGTLSTWETGAVMVGGALPGLAITWTAHRRMLRTIPLSVKTGNQMLPYVLEDREQDDSIEIAYIDKSSGTYFTKLYAI
jgi:hypothetical protein